MSPAGWLFVITWIGIIPLVVWGIVLHQGLRAELRRSLQDKVSLTPLGYITQDFDRKLARVESTREWLINLEHYLGVERYVTSPGQGYRKIKRVD